MSSAEEGEGRPAEGSRKKRKLQRACDVCKRKKIGCDGARMSDKRCSNCIAGSFECTYVAASKVWFVKHPHISHSKKQEKKRAPSRTYVEGLENRLGKMEQLLQRFVPDADIAHEIVNEAERSHWTPDKSSAAGGSSSFTGNISSPSGSSMTPPFVPTGQPELTSQVDDELEGVSEHLKHLTIEGGTGRFFGPSSSFALFKTALDIKDAHAGKENADHKPHVWDIYPWERHTMEHQEFKFEFPEDDLRIALVDLFFEKHHPFLPLLHRPTFERSIEQKLHLSHKMFGATVMMVCAIASRYSDDPRVFLDELEGTDKLHSSGWKYFRQVQTISKSVLAAPSLYELQFYCLATMFLQGSSVPQACWTLAGVGLRLAQEAGAHRRGPMKPTVASELWKRAFWMLVCIDISISSFVGRPCCMTDDQFDVDLPVECDDEYWEHPDPEQAFKQPPGKPPLIAYFNACISLSLILGQALRTIYSIKKSTIAGQEQKIVAELDSSLNHWLDSVPEHLRWDPNRENDMFFNQSAAIYATYYHVQILIHRPFITSSRTLSVLSFPSLAICTNAARSCCHVMESQRRRGSLAMPHVQIAVFTAGVVLLLNIWGGQAAGIASNKSKGMKDVNTCIQVMKEQEDRWHSGRRFCNLLYALASAGHITFADDPPRNKRQRETGCSTATTSPLSDHSFPHTPESHGDAGQVSIEMPTTAPTIGHVPQDHQSIFTHPMSSNELGRLPVYGQFENPAGNNTGESAFFHTGHLTPFDPSLPGYISQSGNTLDLPSTEFANDLFYDQMASIFSNWKGPVPELPYQQLEATIPRPYQYNDVSHGLPMDDGYTLPYTHGAANTAIPAVWHEPESHKWNSTYSSLQGGNAPQDDRRYMS